MRGYWRREGREAGKGCDDRGSAVSEKAEFPWERERGGVGGRKEGKGKRAGERVQGGGGERVVILH